MSRSVVTGLIEFTDPDNMGIDTRFMPLYPLEVDLYANKRPKHILSGDHFEIFGGHFETHGLGVLSWVSFNS